MNGWCQFLCWDHKPLPRLSTIQPQICPFTPKPGFQKKLDFLCERQEHKPQDPTLVYFAFIKIQDILVRAIPQINRTKLHTFPDSS